MSEIVSKHGSAMLRLMGDQASYSDLRSTVDLVVSDQDFRSGCNLLSCLVIEEALHKRQEMCRSMTITLLSDCPPQSGNSSTEDLLRWRTPNDFKSSTPVFVSTCLPPPHGKWHHHIAANYGVSKVRGKRGKTSTTIAEFAKLSPYLHGLISALEDLWRVQGHLVMRDG